MYLLIVDVKAPNWLSTMGGISVTGTGISSFGMASTGICSIVVSWASVTVTGVAIPMVTGVGGMLVTCLLLILCLEPVRAQKNTCYDAPTLLSLYLPDLFFEEGKVLVISLVNGIHFPTFKLVYVPILGF